FERHRSLARSPRPGDQTGPGNRGRARRAGRPAGGVSDPAMTTANKITIFRILLIPFFISQVLYYARTGEELHRLLAILCFAAAAISDGVDGYLARHYNQASELGKMLDPLADKLLLVSGLILLSLDNTPHLPQVPI